MTVDVLHCVDLGIFAHVVANIFWEIMGLNLHGTTQEVNCKGIDKAMRQFQKKTKTKNLFRGEMKVETIRTSGGWPKLKCKGACVHSVVPFALQLAEDHLSPKHIGLCKMMVRFYEILDSQPLWMAADARVEISKLGQVFCDTYVSFASEAFDAQIRMWKGSPKLHAFQHLCEWQAVELGNPRAWWCYSDEDMVGRMVTAAQSCHPSTMALVTTWKWLLGVYELEVPESDDE